VKDKQVWIPNLGWVKTKESYHYQGAGKINNAVISRQADRWYVSISVSLPIEQKPPRQSVEKQDCVGVDLGISHLATCSEGHKVENPKALSKNLKKLKRLSQALSRKVKGSYNRYKAKLQLSTLHQRIKNIRKDALHKLSYYLTTKFNTVVLEDLNVKGMMQNGKLSRAIADVGFYELRRQVEYKAKYYGAKVIFADRFYPSSKLCSVCGFKHEGLTLKDREWQCPHCETSHERDVNAALNLRQLGLTKIAASSTVTACGEFGSGV
jgi:putative transposase